MEKLMKQEFDRLPALEQSPVFPEFPVTVVELDKKGVQCIVEIEGLLTLVTEGVE